MRRIQQTIQLGVVIGLCVGTQLLDRHSFVSADAASAPSLTISQIKVTTGNQFVTLYNATDNALDMSRFQLEYFNNFDLSKTSSSKLIPLVGTLPPHGYYMISDGSALLCYQLTVDSVSLGFSTTAGLVEVLGFSQSAPGGSISPALKDYVGWSKTVASGAQTLPANAAAFLLRQQDALGVPSVLSPGSGSWQSVQPDSSNVCDLTTGNTVVLPPEGGQLLLPTEPPATILPSPTGAADGDMHVLPSADIGLKAPQITELLPNPLGTGNDATDEYIELYNANDQSFDLSNFILEAGTTSLHDAAFPAGTTMPPKSFMAFYSAKTGLSLSNTSGKVALLDPMGNGLSASEPYTTAKDGVAWALANGKWYWTTQPTPNAANKITQPVTSKTSSSAKSKTAASKSSASTTAPKPPASADSFEEDDSPLSPIHPLILATAGGIAILYGAYEYRKDISNQITRLATYARHRRADRK